MNTDTKPHSPAPWTQGYTLITPQTRRWSKTQIAANDQIEKLLVFSKFTASDMGRSRELVCQVRNIEDVPLIVAAPEMLHLLKMMEDALTNPRPGSSLHIEPNSYFHLDMRRLIERVERQLT